MVHRIFHGNGKKVFNGMLNPNKPNDSKFSCASKPAYPASFQAQDSFENYAFGCLYVARHNLGIADIFRCTGGRVDGYIKTATRKSGDAKELEHIERVEETGVLPGVRELEGQNILGKIVDENEIILIEVKTTLSWGSMGAALTEFLTGNTVLKNHGILKNKAVKGLIIFNQFSSDWTTAKGGRYRPWAHLDHHINELSDDFTFDALQLTDKGFFNPRM